MFSSRCRPARQRAALRSASRASTARLAAPRERSMGRCRHTAPASACARRPRRSRCWSRCIWTSAAGRSSCRGERDPPSSCSARVGYAAEPDPDPSGLAEALLRRLGPAARLRAAGRAPAGRRRGLPRRRRTTSRWRTSPAGPTWQGAGPRCSAPASRWPCWVWSPTTACRWAATVQTPCGGRPGARVATALLHVASGGGAKWRRHCTGCSPWCEGVRGAHACRLAWWYTCPSVPPWPACQSSALQAQHGVLQQPVHACLSVSEPA